MKAYDPMIPEDAAASLTGRARTDALHAVRVLAEAAESSAGEEDLPPLPAELRDQWQETYGEALPAPAAPAAAGIRESRLRRLARFLSRPRVAWAGGLAAAAAVLVLLMQPPDTATGPDNGGGVITRGGSSGTAVGTATRIIVVAPADKAAVLLAELTRAFPARSIERADAASAHTEAGAIVIDAAARTIRRDGAAFSIPEGDPLAAPPLVIMAIESLDEPAPR
jgi:hypothetical protein